MYRKISSLAFAFAALPLLAWADSNPQQSTQRPDPHQLPAQPLHFDPPAKLPLPGPGQGRPTPKLHLLPQAYDLSCTLGRTTASTPPSPGRFTLFADAHAWTVRNSGRNTAPAALAFHTQFGALSGNFHLAHDLAPGDSEDFLTLVLPRDPPLGGGDRCTVAVDQ